MYRQILAGILVMAAPALLAQGEAGRGVARVSLVNGDVTIQRGDSGDWIAAAVNAPLVSGDRVFAARASRAEVQLDHSNFVRLGEDTEVKMADLENGRFQVQVSKGIITYRILRESTGQVEINTPAVAVRPLGRGSYRIEVQENGETQITARDGEAEIYAGQGTERLREGRTLIARLGPQDRAVEVQEIRAAGGDDWDRWNERRDKQMSEARSNRYVHSSVWGVEDLDSYGSWRDVDGSGAGWFPNQVSVGWSPYSNGRWVWVDYYGWTWLGYEPWGWAPYHWGRWSHHDRFGWGWYPGSAYTRDYWSPALVGFFGWGGRGGGVGIGFGYGNVGWVPLARGERFYPWYGRGSYGRGRAGYLDNSVNITNVTNIRNVYRNAGVNGGMVSVNTEDFARGRVTNPRRVSVADVGNAGQIRGLVPVVPEQESLRLSDRSVRATPRTQGRDRFMTRQPPAAVERVPFNEQRQQIERSVRSAGGPDRRREGGLEAGASPAAAGPASPSVRAVAPQQSDGNGWRRFGDERRAVVTPQNTDRPAEQPNGWRRMGQERRPEMPAAQSGDVVVVRPQSTDRGVNRSGSSGRLGEERRAEPQSVSPAPAPERRREMEMQRFPAPARERSEPRAEPRQEQQRVAPRAREQSWVGGSGGGGRQIELNRPIVVPRARQESSGGGGGARMSAPPPSRGDGGGRSVDRSGGGGDGGGGRSAERGGGGGGRSRH